MFTGLFNGNSHKQLVISFFLTIIRPGYCTTAVKKYFYLSSRETERWLNPVMCKSMQE